ncbi:acyl CoA:acetate/3-ketoacid CoA transferase [Youngiibacter multivorans]|uniref:Propionate CoA-transferase n=1 Tax=Youngiibacter multivorans TaxID=937251 RepID=A0ABS4G8W3_9CLOT|nr:malonate decarboxylase subunit alpha [Youngiibacter multivorans]MBP1920837.1 propionate CoA-transferase [Youngiibacter multivorans]
MTKIIDADSAALLIHDGATIGAACLGLIGWPEEVSMAIEKRFLNTGSPRNLTIVHSSASGNWKDKGTHHLGYEGLVKKLVCAHTGAAPRMAKLVEEQKIECYLFPQGVVSHMFRAMASKKPGVITKVGLGTYADPRIEGGKITPQTKDDMVKVIEIEGEEYLLYKSVPVDIALLKASVADEKGNLSFTREAGLTEQLALATAVKNAGGIVIAQVENIAKANSLNPKDIRVPGIMVDYVVVARPENHLQTMGTYYNPSFAGEIKIPLHSIEPLPLDERKIIARRATMELAPNTVINLGVGMPDGVASVAAEEGVSDMMTLTTELGLIGGVPGGGLDFGAAYNADSMIEMDSMFDFYDGGGLDAAFLGLAQTDISGNVNVSKFGPKVMGPGGFINITQNSKKVIFCGTFTAGGLVIEVVSGKLNILNEGKSKKFINEVDQITFSGSFANSINQPVLYITERAVFTLENGEMTLIEIAPGVDLTKDILGLMDFKPKISPNLKEMDSAIFNAKWGGLKQILDVKKSGIQ